LMLTDRLFCIGVCTADGVRAGDSPPPVTLAADGGGESALN